jgi:hypothetical protein
VFFFGNLVGDTGPFGAGGAVVDGADYLAARRGMGRVEVPLTDAADHNRDGRISSADLKITAAARRATLPPVAPVPAARRATFSETAVSTPTRTAPTRRRALDLAADGGVL